MQLRRGRNSKQPSFLYYQPCPDFQQADHWMVRKQVLIHQRWVTKEQAPSLWGHHWNQLQRVILMMKMAAFLDCNLPEQRRFPDHCVTEAPQGLPLCFMYLFLVAVLIMAKHTRVSLWPFAVCSDRLLKWFLPEWSERKVTSNTERERESSKRSLLYFPN